MQYIILMKAVILAGGRGTRLSEETNLKPKPLVEANGKPLIWHIMKNYSRSGITDFVILSGYKGNLIREYFANFWLHQADLTFDLTNASQEVHNVRGLPWKVTVIDTGINTNTGGRIGRLRDLLKEDFFLSYGDGISDIDFTALLELHKENKNFITLTAVQPPARFGALKLMGTQVQSFQEKPEGDGAWVNGGFFVITPKIFDYIDNDSSSLEIDVLPKIASQGKLGAYKHFGYWQPVDTIRDLQRLEESIESGSLPWI
jgi:glucose-1-phosphate cytidylyltransferase